MKSIKVTVFGWDGFTCQIPRIKEAFLSMNHQIDFENPDFIFANDPTGFKNAIELKIQLMLM